MTNRDNTPMALLSALLIVPLLAPAAAPNRVARPSSSCAASLATELVDLQTTGKIALAGGTIALKPVMSPFGIAVTPEGRGIFDATTTVKGLPDPSSLGPQFNTYVLWVASPSLDQVRNLGPIKNDTPVTARVDFMKMMYMVTAESTANAKGAMFKGAIVLVGRSASARVQNLAGCDIYDTANGMGG
jgi:hypothetical protein